MVTIILLQMPVPETMRASSAPFLRQSGTGAASRPDGMTRAGIAPADHIILLQGGEST